MTTKQKLEALCTSLIDARFPLHSRAHKMQQENLYVKRDDELNFGISGSKLRKYVSLIPFLKKQNKKTVALVGSPYSNHILSFVQLLKQEGIPYLLFLEKTHNSDCKGNFFFLSLLVVEKEIIWIEKAPEFLSTTWIKEMEDIHRIDCIWIPLGACMDEALPGALTLPLDILQNEVELGVEFSHIFVDAGTGITAAALIIGLAYLQKQTKVHVVLMAGKKETFESLLFSLKSYTEALLGEVIHSLPNYTPLESVTAKSFGSCNSTILSTIVKTARAEGIFLDPIYTAKLLLTTKSTVKENSLEGDILWIHSGGALSLSGFQNSLIATTLSTSII